MLIRPFSRSQILAAKAINTLLFALLGTLVLFLSSFLASNLFLVSESPFTSTDYNQLPAIVVALVYAANEFTVDCILYDHDSVHLCRHSLSKYGSGIRSSCVVREQHHQLHHAFAIEKYPWLKWNPFNFMNIKDTVPTLLHQTDMQNAIIDPGLNYWEMTIGLLLYSLLIYFLTNWLFNKRDVALS